MPRHYGPQMTEQRVLELDKTEFPHMLPPRGTWKHWFLTSRLFHTWFALVSSTSAEPRQNTDADLRALQWVLMALVAFAYYEHWTRSTIFRENLPDRWTVLLHPMQATQEFIIAYRMSSRIGDGYTASVRKHGVDDCQKRASYRKAHGGGDDQGMQWWPDFERKYGHMVVDKKTGRLTDDQAVKKEYEGEVFWKVVKLYNKWMNN